ncbi:hypothetical protein [Streptomyces sp. bgisy091]|uniref:hypothetical protein n=1 Tax=Streptomyces sp. bgisy091 TaxID=3413778 RepID=UPI003D712398
MARRPRTPNTALAALMASGGIGNAQLARRGNAAGRELGITLHYDKTSVSHWLAGSVPKPEARPAITEALSRLLARPVTCAEIGWPSEDKPVAKHDVVTGVVDLSRADMDPTRRGVLKTGMYAAVLAVPRYEDLAGRLESASAGRTLHVGQSDVQTVRTMTDKVADILDQVGAGHARPMAAAFLVNTAGPYLRASGSDRVTRDMQAAVADFVYLTGWMAMYEDQQGLGQKYYLRALELAGAAEDHVTYCRTLRGMSLQATHLGHGKKGLELAEAAAEAALSAGPRLVAFLRGQQAAAAAIRGCGYTGPERHHFPAPLAANYALTWGGAIGRIRPSAYRPMLSVAVSSRRSPSSTYSQKTGLLAAQPPYRRSFSPRRAPGDDQAAACGVPGESRRDTAVHRPVAELGAVSTAGIPYLRPEVQLYYKVLGS